MKTRALLISVLISITSVATAGIAPTVVAPEFVAEATALINTYIKQQAIVDRERTYGLNTWHHVYSFSSDFSNRSELLQLKPYLMAAFISNGDETVGQGLFKITTDNDVERVSGIILPPAATELERILKDLKSREDIPHKDLEFRLIRFSTISAIWLRGDNCDLFIPSASHDDRLKQGAVYEFDEFMKLIKAITQDN